MKIIPCEQNTPEWQAARCGIPTASEIDSLVTPLGKLRSGEVGITTCCPKWRTS